ncbi:probable G-protein coupled receptor Mth-like 14 [Uranotaenia lowii]|uniref:probable G-protein coupled receptor Mth-like 14 n=1 Tax=Uranotaenia lowii TaxID=190385 RepID=UPI00247AC648|nr:probable G-protein coupled receptor Mth-like 14 [Uranotaenia lowii]XP_055599235.1 probable G-protein coupled receptor Mth-like 14 [Uranotaenia lowii]
MHSRARLKNIRYLGVCLLFFVVSLPSLCLGDSLDGTTSKAVSEVENAIDNALEPVTPGVVPVANVTDIPGEVVPIAVTTIPGTSSSSSELPSSTPEVTSSSTTTTSSTSTTAKTTTTPPTTTETTGKSQPQSLPPNCAPMKQSPIQPVYDKDSHIKKCCPFGERFRQDQDGNVHCIPGNGTLSVATIYAVFYGDGECIEDKENQLHFNYVQNDTCVGNSLTFLYNETDGDEMFVIQNGSLLIVNGPDMIVYDQYCVDMDGNSRLLAKACEDVEPIELRATAVLIYIGMVLVSVTLLFTCLAYALVPKLHDVFGYLIAVHAGSFFFGLILMSLAVCGDRCVAFQDIVVLQVFGQIFLMSAIFVFLLMNVHNFVYAAYYIPNGFEFDPTNKKDVFICLGVLYVITLIPLFLPWKNALIFHLILYIYYLAIVVVLYLSHRAVRILATSKFVRFTANQPQQQYTELTYMEAVNSQPRINGQRVKDIQALNRLCTVEAFFTLICWVLFSSLRRNWVARGDDIYRIGAAYMLIVQGLLIGVLFVGGRKKWTIIRECWYNSGSLDLRAMEMEREMKTLERTAVPLL